MKSIRKFKLLREKYRDLEVESNQFQNNLEFFSSSNSENPLFKNVSTKIESIEKKIEFWRDKLKKLKKSNFNFLKNSFCILHQLLQLILNLVPL